MNVDQIYTGCLAHAAYYIERNSEAAIFDPLREVQPYLDRAKRDNAKIKYVFETHFHADFVSGHLDLKKHTGAEIVFGPMAKPGYEATVAEDGQIFVEQRANGFDRVSLAVQDHVGGIEVDARLGTADRGAGEGELQLHGLGEERHLVPRQPLPHAGSAARGSALQAVDDEPPPGGRLPIVPLEDDLGRRPEVLLVGLPDVSVSRFSSALGKPQR